MTIKQRKIVNTPKGKAVIFYDRKITPKDKKYSVITPKLHLKHFGQIGYVQYKDSALGKYKKLDHLDKKRRDRYRFRHRKDFYNDPEHPGYYSWWFLW